MLGRSWQAIKQSKGKQLLAMATVYDYSFACMAQEAGLDMVLVGDSAANVVLGNATTREISLDFMLTIVGAVRRGAKQTHLVADIPYGRDETVQLAMQSARGFMDAGADAVKLEGMNLQVIETLVKAEIPVMGHLGLLPQTATNFRQRGREPQEAADILRDARALQEAGIYALVLEHIPDELGKKVTTEIQIPVIGIGAGPYCDGQVLVLHDLLGLHNRRLPPFARKYADLYEKGTSALRNYADDVRAQAFPPRSTA